MVNPLARRSCYFQTLDEALFLIYGTRYLGDYGGVNGCCNKHDQMDVAVIAVAKA